MKMVYTQPPNLVRLPDANTPAALAKRKENSGGQAPRCPCETKKHTHCKIHTLKHLVGCRWHNPSLPTPVEMQQRMASARKTIHIPDDIVVEPTTKLTLGEALTHRDTRPRRVNPAREVASNPPPPMPLQTARKRAASKPKPTSTPSQSFPSRAEFERRAAASLESERKAINKKYAKRSLSVEALAEIVFPKIIPRNGFDRDSIIHQSTQISDEEMERLLSWFHEKELARLYGRK